MSDPVVIRQISRSPVGMLDAFSLAGVSTVHESLGRRGFLGVDIRPIQKDVSVAGNAVTVSAHPGDNLMIHAAVEVCRENDIMVVANSGPSSHGMFGDLLATSLMARGVRGLVIDAGVRDVSALREMGFPVWSRFVSPLGTQKRKAGSVNVPVNIGGVTIRPGDVVCADDDGVVVVPREETEVCLQAARRRLERESAKRERLAAGELSLDMDGLRDGLSELGVRFIDSAPDED